MVFSIRSLLLIGVAGSLLYVRELSADEPQRRAPEAELYYGAVAFEGALSSNPVLKLTNTETLTEVRLDQISAPIAEPSKREAARSRSVPPGCRKSTRPSTWNSLRRSHKRGA